MHIKFVDLSRQNRILKKELMSVIEGVVDQASFIMGKYLEDFEKSFARFCNKKYAVGVNSGTDALKLGLLAYGVKPGDEVITVANGYFSDAMVISEIGATPVFVDIDPDLYTMDANELKKAITKKTKAMIPVHMYGQSVDMDAVLKIAKEYNLVVLEDACQAHGAQYKGKVLPYGETGAFSFYPSKNLGCFGDGGAIVTDNYSVYEKVMYLRNDGSHRKYIHEVFGFKSRLDALQAAILSVKLPYLEKWNRKRRQAAKRYTELLKKISQVKTPVEKEYGLHVYHLYVIETKKRDLLRIYLSDRGVESEIHYPVPIHLQKPYREKGYNKEDFPIAEEKSNKILSLPMFPELKDEEILYVCKTIKDFFKNYDI